MILCLPSDVQYQKGMVNDDVKEDNNDQDTANGAIAITAVIGML